MYFDVYALFIINIIKYTGYFQNSIALQEQIICFHSGVLNN